MRPIRFAIAGALLGVTVIVPTSGRVAEAATSADINGPSGSGAFGSFVHVLANGNFVVVDPTFSSPTATKVGAVHLYNGATRQLISTLTGSSPNDMVGSHG